MLLLGALLLVPLTVGPEQLAILMSQKPSDCDWLTLPLGEKHCHYDGIAVHDQESERRSHQRQVAACERLLNRLN